MRLFLPAALVLFANWGNLALAQTPQSSLPPEVMNSIYQYGYPSKETVAIRLQGDSEQLKVDEKWSDGKVASTLLRYKNITFIRIQAMPIYAKSEKNYFFVETLDKTVYLFPLRTEEEAKLVAAYVARQTGLVPLDNEWLTRRAFRCPKEGGLGCRSFKEMLDHDDHDIIEAVYSDDPDHHVYACFDESSDRFFMVSYEHSDVLNYGYGSLEEFRSGQSTSSELFDVDWNGQYGRIKTVLKQPSEVMGTLDSSAFNYQVTFQNKLGTVTDYNLSIRWSTGKFVETYTIKNEKDGPDYKEIAGVCSKLN